jgi:histidine ammonia-lyase
VRRLTRRGSQDPVAALCDAVAGLSTAEPAVLLSAEATRAVLFVKAGELIRAKAPPRAALLRFLAGLLAAGVLPALPASDADADALAALANALCGGGLALQGDGASGAPLSAALAAAGLTPPGLTDGERAAVLAGAAPSVAVAALAVARARKLLPAAEAVSVLSCEARARASPALTAAER